MNIALICNVLTKEPIAVIGVNKKTGDIGYIAKNLELENVLETLIGYDSLEFKIKENINDNILIRIENIDSKNSSYLSALNDYLPYPWKILSVSYSDKELEESIKEVYDYMEELKK